MHTGLCSGKCKTNVPAVYDECPPGEALMRSMAVGSDVCVLQAPRAGTCG